MAAKEGNSAVDENLIEPVEPDPNNIQVGSSMVFPYSSIPFINAFYDEVSRRFGNNPIVQNYLDILGSGGTQGNILQIIDKIAELFENHLDLLQTFATFLPCDLLPHLRNRALVFLCLADQNKGIPVFTHAPHDSLRHVEQSACSQNQADPGVGCCHLGHDIIHDSEDKIDFSSFEDNRNRTCGEPGIDDVTPNSQSDTKHCEPEHGCNQIELESDSHHYELQLGCNCWEEQSSCNQVEPQPDCSWQFQPQCRHGKPKPGCRHWDRQPVSNHAEQQECIQCELPAMNFISVDDIEGCQSQSVEIDPDKKVAHTLIAGILRPTFYARFKTQYLKKSCGPKSRKKYKWHPSVANVARYGSYKYIRFFDEARISLKSHQAYINLLKFIHLFSEDLITVSELVKSVTSLLSSYQMLLKEFKDMVRYDHPDFVERIPQRVAKRRKVDPDIAMENDYFETKNLGASYRQVPSTDICSGRTALCNEVLNDTWVSFAAWSEESTFVPSRKTEYEEIMYRVEDERYELDIAIQSNASTIKHLEHIEGLIDNTAPDERRTLCFDRTLGTGTVLHERNIKRVYGERITEVMEGLQRNPTVAVPIVHKRLKIREEEWKMAYKTYDEMWRVEIDKYHLKSLDILGINFKQNDLKNFRPKKLLSEIEVLSKEQQWKISRQHYGGRPGPNFIHYFSDYVFEDAVVLIVQHLSRQSAFQETEKKNMELLLYSFIAQFIGLSCDVFYKPKDKSDKPVVAEGDPATDTSAQNPLIENTNEKQTGVNEDTNKTRKKGAASHKKKGNQKVKKPLLDKKPFLDKKPLLDKTESLATDFPSTLFFGTDNWYVFFRLFHFLCDRLATLYQESKKMEVERKTHGPQLSDVEKDITLPYDQLFGYLMTGKPEITEDEARRIFGIHGYLCLTLDKLIHAITKQLHQIGSEDLDRQCVSLNVKYIRAINALQTSSPRALVSADQQYQVAAQKMIGIGKCYMIIWNKHEAVMTIQLLSDGSEHYVDFNEAERWSTYLDTFMELDRQSQTVGYTLSSCSAILQRNLRRQIKYWEKAYCLRQNINSSTDNKSYGELDPCDCVVSVNENFDGHHSSLCVCSQDTGTGSNILVGVNQVEKTYFGPTRCIHGINNFHDTFDNDKKNSSKALNDCFTTQNLNADDVVMVTSVDAEFNENLKYSDNNVLALPIATQVIVSSEDPCGKLMYEVTTVEGNCSSQGFSSVIELDDIDEKQSGHLSSCDMKVADKETNECELEELDSDSITVSVKDLLASPSYSDSTHGRSNLYPVVTDIVVKKEMLDEIEHNSEQNAFCYAGHYMFPAEHSESQERFEFQKHSEYQQHIKPQKHSRNLRNHSQCGSEIRKVKTEVTSPSSNNRSRNRSKRKISEMDESTHVKQISKKRRCTLKKKSAVDLSVVKAETLVEDNNSSNELNKDLVPEISINSLSEPGTTSTSAEALQGIPTDKNCILQSSYQMAVESCFIEENTEVKISRKTFKMRYVCDTGDFIYRVGSLSKAKQTHKKLYTKRKEKFSSWHLAWVQKNVTPAMLTSCRDWFCRDDAGKLTLNCVTVNQSTNPPYGLYTKYVFCRGTGAKRGRRRRH